MHGQPLEEVHFHEVGAADSILDIVGVAYGIEALGITRTFVSPIPQGWGMIAGAHGHLPNPAPATVLLLQGFTVYGTDLPGELVTPTGALILKALKAESELCPPLRLSRVDMAPAAATYPGTPTWCGCTSGSPCPRRRA